MADIWWKADPLDLHRLVDRVSSIYVERSHIDRDENAVVLINKRETVRVPAALIAVMLLGPGTRITHGAVNLLGDSGTAVCWVGEQGVRLYASGLGPSRGAGLLNRQAWLVSRRQPSPRCTGRATSPSCSDASTWQGRCPGAQVLPRALPHRYPLEWLWVRAGDPFAAGDDLNRLLSGTRRPLRHLSGRHRRLVPARGLASHRSATSFVMDSRSVQG